MTTQWTRKDFLAATASGTVLLLLQACGGGSSDGDGAGSGADSTDCGASGAAISGNHGHVLEIPATDLDSATDMTYGIQGTSGHSHAVTLTAAQLASLKAGASVTVTSTTVLQHDHMVTASCA
jgi:hypothetical protein